MYFKFKTLYAMKRITKSCLLLLLCALMPTGAAMAQDAVLLDGEDNAYVQKTAPKQLSNYRNSTFFADGKNVWNLRGGKLLSAKNITHLVVSPTGKSFAVVRQGEKSVGVYDLWKKNKKVGTVKLKQPVANCCFAADGTRLFVVDETGTLSIFSCADFKQIDATPLSFVPTQMQASENGQYLALSNGSAVTVISAVDKSTVATPELTGRMNAMGFSSDSKDFAILMEDGTMQTFDTRTFTPQRHVEALGEARDCYYHPGGKYVVVVTGDARILLVNLVDTTDRFYVESPEGGVTEAFFAKDERGTIYLVYNTANAIHYKQMSEMPPYYTKLMEDEVTTMMAEWELRMPEETLEAYQIRVNDETRAAQRRLFEEQVATRMAEDIVNLDQVNFSTYNPETGMMTLDFEGMDPIYIDVPKDEVGYFTSASDVELRNPIYMVDENDQFQLVYADVYNKKTGKTYTFNNRERKSLDYLADDNGFIPLEYVQQGNMEAMKLDELKNQVVTNAMQQNSLSEHTQISVNTKTFTETNADGKQLINYQVSFGYEVDANFSESEDFAPGRYKAEQSAAAQTMLKIISQAMQTDFAQYMKEGKKVIIKITGSADASPIKRTIPYGGEYGDYNEEPVFQNGKKGTISVSKASGISTNEQLAFLRAMGMKDSIRKNIASLDKMDSQYETHIEQGEGVGGQFRRILVDFTFIDAY